MIIGIDPDMHASGFAVVSEGKVVSLRSVKLHDLIDHVQQFGNQETLTIKLEDPAANKGLFAIHGDKNKAVSIAVAIAVGKVQATTHHIKELLEDYGFAVRMVKPIKGPVKRQAKGNAEYFNKLTGWKGRSNQDQRDAALIALWG